MGPISSNQISGHVVKMTRTNPGHLDSNGQKTSSAGESSDNFGNLVTSALGRVSDRQEAADEIFERMITHPDEVEPHDVTISMAKAEMSLNITKAIVDRAVSAYNDITAMR